jgi:hypothetical protein
MISKKLAIMKWVAQFCFVVGTITLLSPTAASTAIFPWALYLIGNAIWAYDSYVAKDWPWAVAGTFFAAWDVLLIATRILGIEFFTFLLPLVKLLEILP